MKRLRRKDKFLILAATLWLATNVLAFILYGGREILPVTNTAWILLLVILSSCRRFMNWLNGDFRR